MRVFLLVLALVPALLLGGCDALSGGDDPFRAEPVVTAVLAAGEPLPPVTLTQTAPIGAFYTPTFIEGATVTVSLLRADGSVEASHAYVPLPDGAYGPADGAVTVQGGRRYRLTAALPGQAAPLTAETTVPTAFEIVEAPPDSVTYQEGEGPAVRLTRSTFPGRQTIYLFTVRPLDPVEFRREEDTSTPEAGDSVWVAVEGTGYGPTPFTANLIFDRDVDPESFLVGNSPLLNEANADANPDGTLTLRLPWLSVSFYGPLEVTITAFDDALVRFFQTQAVQTVPTTISPGEIPNVDSNVENGHGVFGAVAQVRIETFVRERPQP